MKTAVITGASGGIGSAIALAFASNNYNVVLQYNHNSKKAISLANKIQEKFNVTALAVKADVSSSQEVEKMFDFIAAKLGNVDVLINNAGIAQQKLFTDITDDDWHKMIGTNLDGVFYCCREVLKRFMIKNHSGVILNISSMWGQVGASCEVHYSAAKAGVIGLTKALAKEVGLSQIRVNCIAPGVVMTDLLCDRGSKGLHFCKSFRHKEIRRVFPAHAEKWNPPRTVTVRGNVPFHSTQ